MRKSARTRLEIALQSVGCRHKVPENLIDEASKAYDIDVKIECFKQWAAETDEIRKKAQIELGEDFNPVFGWRDMPVEKAIEILAA